MKDFFVSYNKADKHWAEWIAWTLEEAGYSVIIQAWDFRPGGNFVLDMQQAAVGTKRTLAVLSEDYLKAAYTQPEWASAFKCDPQSRERILIPIRVRECKPEGLLGPIVYVDLVGLAEQDARSAILGAFSERAKPTQAPAFPGHDERLMSGPVQYPGDSAALGQPVQPSPILQFQMSSSAPDRLELIKTLNALPVEQFNILVFTLNPPSGLIPPIPASQGNRTFALLQWAEGSGGCGLLQVQQVLAKLINP